jgi:hypothetical protein
MYNFTCVVFFYIHKVPKKNTLVTAGNLLKKMQFTIKARLSPSFFTKWIRNVIYVSTKKELIRFKNCLGVPSRLWQGKGWKAFSHFKCLNGQHLPYVPVPRSKLELTISRIWSIHATLCFTVCHSISLKGPVLSRGKKKNFLAYTLPILKTSATFHGQCCYCINFSKYIHQSSLFAKKLIISQITAHGLPLRSSPEGERSSHPLRGGSLKSREVWPPGLLTWASHHDNTRESGSRPTALLILKSSNTKWGTV